jgi:hypothetical protein
LSRTHHTDYDEATTARCERTLVTLLGDLGPWRERITAFQDRHENKDAYDLVFTLLRS